jgi:chemotaxis protein MotB
MTQQPIVIKRIYKVEGHHGGSWKVAFADFATAMMAFFLLMWLMGATDETQKGAISEFFNNPSAVPGASSMPPPAASLGDGSPSNAVIDLGGSMQLPRDDATENSAADDARAALEQMREELQSSLREQTSLGEYADHLLIDITPEGLRIQIVDQDKRSMFALGSARLESFAESLIGELARILDKAENVVSISGHTDALPLSRPGYSNWELSSDRANAARRALIGGGLQQHKLGRVVGLGETMPLLEHDPTHAVNRRISILVMNADALASMRAASRGFVSVE